MEMVIKKSQQNEHQRQKEKAASRDKAPKKLNCILHKTIQPTMKIYKNRYHVKKEIGKGSYGTIMLAFDTKTKTNVALKIIKISSLKTESLARHLEWEIKISQKIQHPNIVKCFEIFERDDEIVFVLEYVAGGDLYEFLRKGRLTKTLSRRFFRQIICAVYYLHCNGICHRDLKLENILVDNQRNIRLIDFGLSIECKKFELLDNFCGSRLYISPEIVNCVPYTGPPADMWALGVILFALEYKRMPFSKQRPTLLSDQIKNALYKESIPISDASALIKSLLTISPENRANIDVVCKSKWLNQGYQEPLLTVAKNLAEINTMKKEVDTKDIATAMNLKSSANETYKVSTSLMNLFESNDGNSLKLRKAKTSMDHNGLIDKINKIKYV